MIQHIAIVPDGNRRWAELHKVSRLYGHQKGADTMHRNVNYLIGTGLAYLTIWGFSTDNWKRSQDEVSDLFDILREWVLQDTPWLHSRQVRLRHIGRLYELPDGLRETIKEAISLTYDNQGMTLNLAFNYSGRGEIIDAVRQMLEHRIDPNLVDEDMLRGYLQSGCSPDVDLVIRTAGECRISNFLLWQSAYAEFYFTDALWPDFNEEELERALSEYSKRQRRFGGDRCFQELSKP